MDENTITVVIPTYRRPKELKTSIESVLQQSYSNLKIIVSDDASNDSTEETVNELIKKDDRIYFYSQNNNIGMNANLNFLFSNIKSNYFCILTDDDYYHKNFLWDAMSGLKENKTAMFSVLSYLAINKSGEIVSNVLDSWPHEGLYKKGQASFLNMSGNHPMITGIIFKKEVLKEVIFSDNYGVASDVPILIKLCAKYDFNVSKKIGTYYVLHENSLSNKLVSGAVKAKERAYLLMKYNKWFNNGLLTNGNTDSEKIARLILKRKILFLGGMTKKYLDKDTEVSLVESINHPIRYLLKAHLYLLNIKIYTNIMLILKQAYYFLSRKL